jgi:thioredoxin reductase/NAD-dependent dihydropyrimidine dehydrogenase PreA subunit
MLANAALTDERLPTMNAITLPSIAVYALPMLTLWAIYIGTKQLSSKRNHAARESAIRAGLTEPASLHPIIDPSACVGCGSCVSACPEQPLHQVLGLIDGKANLINAPDCIGHGACKTACPMDAITLVFGTERRGIDIPHVSPDYSTNVPGIYIAGELGGMGLIRNAIEQGTQAMASIKALGKQAGNGKLDVVIVGAGPAGFAATLAAHKYGLRYLTVEQESLGGTVFQFPRGKLVMTAPVDLPIVGKMNIRETSKEALLEFWQCAERESGIRINYRERIDTIEQNGEGFEIKTTKNQYVTSTVLLAIGRRGTPRKLGVAGEEHPKVVYRLIDPEQYRGCRVLVVGGGDSALEAALSIAAEPETEVTVSYRSEAFSRAKPKNREKIEAASDAGKLALAMKSNVHAITAQEVELEQDGKITTLPNDAIIVCAGGILPTQFLKDTGIEVETKHGTA